MTIEERRQKFQAGLERLAAETGMTFQFDTVHEQHGAMHQIKPVVGVVPIDGWVAPVVEEVVDDGDSSAK